MIIFQFYTEEKDISSTFIFIMLTRVPLTSNIVTVQIITFPKKNSEKNIECKQPLLPSETWSVSLNGWFQTWFLKKSERNESRNFDIFRPRFFRKNAERNPKFRNFSKIRTFRISRNKVWIWNLRDRVVCRVEFDILVGIGQFTLTTKLRGHIHVFYWSYKILISSIMLEIQNWFDWSKLSNLKSHSQSLISTLRNNHYVIITYNFRSSTVAQPQWLWLNWNNLQILIKQDIHSCSQKLDEVRNSLNLNWKKFACKQLFHDHVLNT